MMNYDAVKTFISKAQKNWDSTGEMLSSLEAFEDDFKDAYAGNLPQSEPARAMYQQLVKEYLWEFVTTGETP